jgi:hypothetical protein
MSPDGFFRFFSPRVFELPLFLVTTKKIDKKTKNKNKNKIEQVATFFLTPQQMYVTFVLFFSRRPL